VKTKVAAIQMVSTPELAPNLESAGRLIAAAADAGAKLVALPENFYIIGRHEGDKVALRLAAFPNLGYSKFEGRVTEISSATLAPEEQGGKAHDTQPRYRVRVGLPAQSLDGHALRAGMELDAQFPQERRTLAGWIFEPLYRLKEKL